VGQFDCGGPEGWKLPDSKPIFGLWPKAKLKGTEMAKGREIPVFVAKRRDEKIIKALAKHLNQGTGGQRAARTKRKKGGKK
jgi:hypothetical protein